MSKNAQSLLVEETEKSGQTSIQTEVKTLPPQLQ